MQNNHINAMIWSSFMCTVGRIIVYHKHRTTPPPSPPAAPGILSCRSLSLLDRTKNFRYQGNIYSNLAKEDAAFYNWIYQEPHFTTAHINSVRKIIENCSERKWKSTKSVKKCSKVKVSVVKCSVGKGWRSVMGRVDMGVKVLRSEGLG